MGFLSQKEVKYLNVYQVVVGAGAKGCNSGLAARLPTQHYPAELARFKYAALYLWGLLSQLVWVRFQKFISVTIDKVGPDIVGFKDYSLALLNCHTLRPMLMKEKQYVEFIADIAHTETLIYHTHSTFQVREGSGAEYAED